MKLFNMVTLSVLAFTGALNAAETVNTPATPLDASSDMNRVGSSAEAFGKITSLHNASLVGVTDPHVIVKLTSDQGDIDIVDLGSAADLKQNGLEPKEGQQLWVEGKVGRINDKPLVFAEHISESPLVAINRKSPLREETTKHAEARATSTDECPNAKNAQEVKASYATKSPKTETIDASMLVRTIEGTVAHSRKVQIEGEAEEHMMAKLQTEDGVAVVDLGLVSALPKVDLSEGQAIAVTGYVGKMNDKPIIIADAVGNLNNIQRTTPAANLEKSK